MSKSVGQIGYEAYRDHTGDPIPEWEESDTEVKAGWEAAGEAIRKNSNPQKVHPILSF